MIALNEIIKNKEEYEIKYKKMGYNINLTPFILLENERKIVQIEYENLRAETNKLCASVATLRNQNQDTTKVLKQIEKNNKTIKLKCRQLNIMGKNIDNKLKQLPNIAENFNELNKQIETEKNESTINDLHNFLSKEYKLIKSHLKVKKQLKSLKNRLFQETELPIVYECKNGYLLLFQNVDIQPKTDALVGYLKSYSKYLVMPAVKNLNRSSITEYISTLNSTEFLKVEVKGEYYTREYKIKYKNVSLDTTKFLYEIDIYKI